MDAYYLSQDVYHKNGEPGVIVNHHEEAGLVWVKWEDYDDLCEECLEHLFEKDPTDTTDYSVPLVTPPGWEQTKKELDAELEASRARRGA